MKVYENIIKCRLVDSVYKNISPFISVFRRNLDIQHMLLRLIKEWRENLDKNNVDGGVLVDLSKVFHCVPHDVLVSNLAAYGNNLGTTFKLGTSCTN